MKPKYTPLTLKQVEVYNQKWVSRNFKSKKRIEYKKGLTLNHVQKSVLIGTLLGNASLSCSRPGCSYCIKFEQRGDCVNYVEHLFKLFLPYVGTGPRMRIIKNAFHKNDGVCCWFRTYSHKDFRYYASMFYHKVNDKRTKFVPKDLHKHLDTRALAYWFMDNGSYWPDGRFILNTQGFTLSEQTLLRSVLKRNLHLFPEIRKDGLYHRLDFSLKQSVQMADLIKPYMHPYFDFKLKNLEKHLS